MEVDINATENSSHISATETVTDTPEAPNSGSTATQSQEKSEPYVPFKSGKEKFKFKDAEVEWDWETTKKYAELGRGGRLAMQKASEIEKKATDAYNNLIKRAQSDPEGLLEILNPKYKRGSLTKAQAREVAAEAVDGQSVGYDPRDSKIQELEEKLGSIESFVEQGKIAEERKLIETELDESVKRYPELNNKFYREFVKQEYHKALKRGDQFSIEEVAFFVSQDLKEMEASKAKAQKLAQEKIEKKAPVTSVHGKNVGESEGMTREEVMRLAGRLA